jgi:NAD(P)-dependent dehydrogenase (short-subunit alcohol dehydrogenase family)
MTGKVAIVTGASRGIGAGLVAGYRRQGWAVVTSARTITPSEDPGVLTVTGDIADAEIADRIIGGALRRFGRIDTLVNSAGVFTAKPFTDYTAADYARVVGGSLTGFFWLTQRAIAEMATRYGRHVVSVLATLGEVADPGTPAVLTALTNGGLTAATRSLAIEYAACGIRGQRHLAGPGRAGQVSDVVDGVLLLESSPGITGKILRIDGTPKGQATGRENAG